MADRQKARMGGLFAEGELIRQLQPVCACAVALATTGRRNAGFAAG